MRFFLKNTEKYYFDKDELKRETILSQQNGYPTKRLVEIWDLLLKKFISTFTIYDYATRKDCMQYAYLILLLQYHKIDCNNPNFSSYIVQIIKNAYNQNLNQWNYETFSAVDRPSNISLSYIKLKVYRTKTNTSNNDREK